MESGLGTMDQRKNKKTMESKKLENSNIIKSLKKLTKKPLSFILALAKHSVLKT